MYVLQSYKVAYKFLTHCPFITFFVRPRFRRPRRKSVPDPLERSSRVREGDGWRRLPVTSFPPHICSLDCHSLYLWVRYIQGTEVITWLGVWYVWKEWCIRRPPRLWRVLLQKINSRGYFVSPLTVPYSWRLFVYTFTMASLYFSHLNPFSISSI